MNEEELMAKKFVVPMMLALFAVIYPLCYIFRTSDEAWQTSTIGSVPAGLWALTVPLSLFLTWRTCKKVSAFFSSNRMVEYEEKQLN